MKKAEVKAIVDANIEPWMEKLGIPHWSIEVTYGPCADRNWQASCDRQVAYNQAHIIIDPKHAVDEEGVIRSLVHELLHVVLAPFDLYRDVLSQHCGEAGSVRAREERALFDFTVEQLVVNLRRVVKGMGGIW